MTASRAGIDRIRRGDQLEVVPPVYPSSLVPGWIRFLGITRLSQCWIGNRDFPHVRMSSSE